MRAINLTPEQARREYWKIRERETHKIRCDFSLLCVGISGAIGQRRAEDTLTSLEKLEKLVHFILANKDRIYISKQVMANLLEDAAWLEKVRAEAESFLKR